MGGLVMIALLKSPTQKENTKSFHKICRGASQIPKPQQWSRCPFASGLKKDVASCARSTID